MYCLSVFTSKYFLTDLGKIIKKYEISNTDKIDRHRNVIDKSRITNFGKLTNNLLTF